MERIIKAHVIPLMGGVITFLIVWTVLQMAILPLLALSNKVAGLLKIGLSVVSGVLINNLLHRRFVRNEQSVQ